VEDIGLATIASTYIGKSDALHAGRSKEAMEELIESARKKWVKKAKK